MKHWHTMALDMVFGERPSRPTQSDLSAEQSSLTTLQGRLSKTPQDEQDINVHDHDEDTDHDEDN